MRTYFFIILSLTFNSFNFAQPESKIFIPSDSLYQSNIKKSKLYGVYIPRDIDDALDQLVKLTDEESRNKLKKVDELTMAKKLHFGLGRWMEYNWNFIEGSRFSHFLRNKGLYHHDDMVKFMLITFHRHISAKSLDTDMLIKQFIEQRSEILKSERDKKVVISILPKKN